MKRAIKLLCIAFIIATLALALAGCSKSGTVKSAFKNAGYEITSVEAKDSTDLTALLKTEEQLAQIGKYSVFTCSNMERTATIIRFPSNSVMQEVLGESTYKTKNDGGYVNGDCYFVSGCTDALYVFKNA